MDPQNLLTFLRKMESLQMEYMVTGSVASILYGKPRLTQDMDVVVVFPATKIAAFPNDQKTGFKIDVYPAGRDELNQWGLENKKRVELIANEQVWVAPPEYVILKKLVYYKEGGSQKHLEDIKGMLEVSGDQIDTDIIKTWITELNLKDCWTLVSKG